MKRISQLAKRDTPFGDCFFFESIAKPGHFLQMSESVGDEIEFDILPHPKKAFCLPPGRAVRFLRKHKLTAKFKPVKTSSALKKIKNVDWYLS